MSVGEKVRHLASCKLKSRDTQKLAKFFKSHWADDETLKTQDKFELGSVSYAALDLLDPELSWIDLS